MQRKRGDWDCPTCEFHNFANRQECFKCQAPRPHDVSVFAGDDDGGLGRGGGGDQGWAGGGGNAYRQREPVQPRPGDWECPSCVFHNFANRHECFKCQAPRPHDGKVFTGDDCDSVGGGGGGGDQGLP